MEVREWPSPAIAGEGKRKGEGGLFPGPERSEGPSLTFIDAIGISGACMFILMPYFTALAATYPAIALNRFGTGMLADGALTSFWNLLRLL